METYRLTIFVYVLVKHVFYLHVEGQGQVDLDRKDMGLGVEGVKTAKMVFFLTKYA